MARVFRAKHLDVLPVAPLLLIGICGTWLILLLS
jgi:hypothetical protein